MRAFHLEIVTLDGSEYNGEAESLLVHTDDGDVEILAGHADLLASISSGRVRVRVDGKDIFAAASGGFLTVNRGTVQLVCVTFEFAENIDVERAMRAKEKAEEAIAGAKDDKALALAKAKLERALSRIGVANLL